VLTLTIGTNCFNFCVESDERRIRFLECSLTKKTKETQKRSPDHPEKKKTRKTLIKKDNYMEQE